MLEVAVGEPVREGRIVANPSSQFAPVKMATKTMVVLLMVASIGLTLADEDFARPARLLSNLRFVAFLLQSLALALLIVCEALHVRQRLRRFPTRTIQAVELAPSPPVMPMPSIAS